jgi:hypothetical protein
VSLTQRLEDLAKLLRKAQFDTHHRRGPGLGWNERYGETYEDQNRGLQQLHAPPRGKWIAYVNEFSASHDDPDAAVKQLEVVVHEAVRKDITERVDGARRALRDAEECMRLVEGG